MSKVTAATSDTSRPKNALYNISYQDCLDDIEFTFALTVAPADQSKFQAWVSDSVDCKTSIARQDGGGCKLLAQAFPGSTGKLSVSAKTLVGMLSDIDTKTCIDSSSTTAARPLKIYFMLVGASDVAEADTYVWEQTLVDLRGPEPPPAKDIRVDPGDGLLILTLPTNTDNDKLGYYIFCSPNPNPPSDSVDECGESGTGASGTTTTTTNNNSGGGGAGGAGSANKGVGGGGGGAGGGTGGTGTGGTSGSTTTTTTTPTTTTTTTAANGGAGGGIEGGGETACTGGETLACVNTQHPSIKSKYVCGERIPASATSPVIEKLKNDQPYVVAIAAYDTVNNIGPLSVLQCATPQPTKTFFGEYCANGGNACNEGCGTCNVGGAGRDLTWPGLAVLALAGAALGVRRDDRRRRARSRAAGEAE